MQNMNEHPLLLSQTHYRELLIKLGVLNSWLTDNLDCALLYQRLSLLSSPNKFICTAKWQLDVLADANFDYTQLNTMIALKDDKGATPIHYAAWSGNIQALEWIKTNPSLWELKDINNSTPLHYAALSGNTEALEWIKVNYPQFWKLNNNNGTTPIHFAAWSGNTQALAWINANYPKLWELKNHEGTTPIHYAAMSGNTEVLDWIQVFYSEHWELKNKNNETVIDFAALSGKTKALDWIQANYPEKLELKVNKGITPLHYAAMSGNTEALDWIQINCPELWELKNNHNATLIDLVALSRNKQALSKALSLKRNPHTWTLHPSEKYNGGILTNTLLGALETNYELTMVDYNGCYVKNDVKEAIEQRLIRNRDIKLCILRYQTFAQGYSQKSPVSMLKYVQSDVGRNILQLMLPPDINVEQVSERITSSLGKDIRSLKLIQENIERLIPSKKENNYLFGLLPLYGFLNNSDKKIAALTALKQIIKDKPENLFGEVTAWENQYSTTITEKRNLFHEFFSDKKTKTEVCVQDIKSILQI